MQIIYLISGFKDYEIKDKILYRKAYRVKDKNDNLQYREKRIIKKVYSLVSLTHRLKLWSAK